MAKDGRPANDALDRDAIWKAFKDAVNLTPGELKRWLRSEESRSVGSTRDGESESVGHESGRRIAKM